jgi:hypothetical protein
VRAGSGVTCAACVAGVCSAAGAAAVAGAPRCIAYDVALHRVSVFPHPLSFYPSLLAPPPEHVESGEEEVKLPLYIRMVLVILNVYMALSDKTLRFYILYVVFTWLGNFVSVFFFSFHLLDIVNRSPTLQAVLSAVTFNGKQLVMTFVLMVGCCQRARAGHQQTARAWACVRVVKGGRGGGGGSRCTPFCADTPRVPLLRAFFRHSCPVASYFSPFLPCGLVSSAVGAKLSVIVHRCVFFLFPVWY